MKNLAWAEILQPILWVQAALLLVVAGAVGWLVVRAYSPSIGRAATMARLLAIDLFVLGVGMGAGAWFGSVYPPIFAITATGMLTFFDLLQQAVRIAPDVPIQDRDLRIAITGAVTTMYLSLVGFGVFLRIGPGQAEAPLAQTLVISFTSVVSVVIAFYFGTTAYLEKNAAPQPIEEPRPGTSVPGS